MDTSDGGTEWFEGLGGGGQKPVETETGRQDGLYDASIAALSGMNATEICIVANAALFSLARDSEEGMLPSVDQWKELMLASAWAISTIDPLVNGEIQESPDLRLCEPDGETLRAHS